MITKELRKYVWDKVPSKHLEDLIGIAGAIEQKHEEELAEQRESLTVGMEPMTDECMAEHGFIELPKDADGKTIRLWDVLEWQGASFTVEGLELDEEGWWTRKDGLSVKCSDARHAKPDSWERILCELAGRVLKSGHQWGLDAPATTAEFVERCKRLAGEDA